MVLPPAGVQACQLQLRVICTVQYYDNVFTMTGVCQCISCTTVLGVVVVVVLGGVAQMADGISVSASAPEAPRRACCGFQSALPRTVVLW